MPIYKTNGKKDGLQKYNVRINYVFNGTKKQLTRVAYGIDNAKDLERELSLKIKNKDIILVKMTLRQLFDKFIASKAINLKKSSIVKIIDDIKNYVFPTFENYYIDKITVEMLIAWQKDFKSKNLALSTMQIAFKQFKALLEYAIKCEYIQKSPFKNLDNFRDSSVIKKEMAFYTGEEFKIFISKAKEIAEEKEKQENNLFEWNFYVFFAIAFYTGARKGEIYALKWSDLDGSKLHIKRSLNKKLNEETSTKTQKAIRTLQIPLPLIKILNEHKERQQKLRGFSDDNRICNNINNSAVSRRNIFYAKESCLTKIRIHDFRHSHASYLANAGILINEISRRLGHTKIEITWNTYCHLYPQEEEKAVKILNRLT